MTSTIHISNPQSHLRPQTATSPLIAYPSSPSNPASKKMSITQAYFLAHKARAKLSSEAARPDHNLRLLVGHANLLDSLMLDLAEAEREQESWFNQSVRASSKSEDRHIQWADSVEEPEHDWHAEDADTDSESDDSDFDDDDDVEMADIISLQRIPSKTPFQQHPYTGFDDMDEDLYEDDDEDYTHLALHRSPSHSQSPPELDHDSDTSEDETMPPSPPTAVLPAFSDKEGAYASPTSDDKDAFYDQGYYLPPRNPARLVSAISVY